MKQQRQKIRLLKRVGFSIATTVAVIALLEGALAFVGVEPLARTTDPYVGFSSWSPLFTEHAETGPDVLCTAPNKLRWFNRQCFSKAKPTGVYRVFCMGGSTTYGRPYDDATSFCGWLRAFLPAADSSKQWEVINCGGVSYASYRVVRLMRELTAYQPDLFVVYTGHNEFLEKRTYASVLKTHPVVRDLNGLLSHTRIHAAARRLLLGAETDDGNEKLSNRDLLPAEVDTRLDQSIGPDAYHRDDPMRHVVVDHFEANLRRMVQAARAAGAEIVLVTPASNLRDCTPFKSEHIGELDDATLRRCRTLHQFAVGALHAGHYRQALEALDQSRRLDDRYAETHYYRGKALFSLERYSEAKAAFVRARDEDVCPLRALTSIQEAVGRVAQTMNVAHVDFASIIDESAEHSIPGDDLFLDHVHPTISGNRMLALSIIERLTDVGVVRPQPDWGPKSQQEVAEQLEGGIDEQAHAAALTKLSKVLNWAGKKEDAARLALRAVALLPDDAETNFQAGNALMTGQRPAEALAQYQKAVKLDPDSAPYHYGLALALSQTGDVAGAKTHYRRALELQPTFNDALYNLAVLLESEGNVEGAAQLYQRAVASTPDDFTSHNNLGILFARSGDWDKARRHFERAVAINPTYVEAHVNLAKLHSQQGRTEQAIQHYRAVLRQHPDHFDAAHHLAWLLATATDASLRDGGKARALAEQCARATNYERADVLNTLAAAYACSGDFNKAVVWQTKAVELTGKPTSNGNSPQDYLERLRMYQSGKPFVAAK